MTVWIQPSEPLQHKAGLPSVPLPVSDETAALFEQGIVDPAAMAIDVSRYRIDAGPDDPKGPLFDRAVAALAFLGAFELLKGGEFAPAIELLELGLAHEPDNVTLRSHLGTALWDEGRRFDALLHLLAAVRWFAERGQVAPALWIITSRVLQEAGRYQDALDLLEDLADTSPREPRFWDLIDAIRTHAAARAQADPSVRACANCSTTLAADAAFCAQCGTPRAAACSECDHPLDPEAAYCTRCGQPVDTTPPPPATTANVIAHAPTPQPKPPPPEPLTTAAEWVYVLDPVEVRGLRDTTAVVGSLQPGTWYLLVSEEGAWARVTDPDGVLEGWAEEAHIRRQAK